MLKDLNLTNFGKMGKENTSYGKETDHCAKLG